MKVKILATYKSFQHALDVVLNRLNKSQCFFY